MKRFPQTSWWGCPWCSQLSRYMRGFKRARRTCRRPSQRCREPSPGREGWLECAALSTLDIRLRPIVCGGFFLVPMAFFVLIGDDSRFARLRLFSSCEFRGLARLVMRAESFGECLIDLVSPAAIVLDDFI